eukprot:1782054-Prymnesium_polylepis.1
MPLAVPPRHQGSTSWQPWHSLLEAAASPLLAERRVSREEGRCAEILCFGRQPPAFCGRRSGVTENAFDGVAVITPKVCVSALVFAKYSEFDSKIF